MIDVSKSIQLYNEVTGGTYGAASVVARLLAIYPNLESHKQFQSIQRCLEEAISGATHDERNARLSQYMVNAMNQTCFVRRYSTDKELAAAVLELFGVMFVAAYTCYTA